MGKSRGCDGRASCDKACLVKHFEASDGMRCGDGACRRLYDEVCRMALAACRRHRSKVTMEPGDLANKTMLRLLHSRKGAWENRAHFFGAAARAMQHSMIDHLRSPRRRLEVEAALLDGLVEEVAPSPDSPLHTREAREVITDLEAADEHLATVVRLRVFTGLSMDQIAEILEVPPRTLDRDWASARAWLRRRLSE